MTDMTFHINWKIKKKQCVTLSNEYMGKNLIELI